MVTRSYANKINEAEVSLAIERLLIAYYPASWTPARIDLTKGSLPSGFFDLGAVAEDSPSFQVSRETFEVKTGLPRIRQFESVIDYEGTFECQLHSNSWRKVQFAFGNYIPTANASDVGTIASVTSDGLTFTMVTTPSTPVTIGQQVILAGTSEFDNPDAIEVRIASITSDELTYTCETVPYSRIQEDDHMAVYSHVQQIIGGRTIRYYHLLGVADFIGGAQIVHEMKKVSPAGDWTEEFRPDNNGMVNLSLNALGFESVINSCTEVVVGLRHYFPPIDNSC